MARMHYLQQQTERAERLAKDVLDALTMQRLKALAAECEPEEKASEPDESSPQADSRDALAKDLAKDIGS